MIADAALQIDLLNNTDSFNTSTVNEKVFINTLMIIQYKLCLDFWSYFNQLNRSLFQGLWSEENSFKVVNTIFEKDFTKLNNTIRKVISNQDFLKLMELRSFNFMECIINGENISLGYSLAFGKVSFWGQRALKGKMKNVYLFNYIPLELTRKFPASLKEAPNNQEPGEHECQLFNLDKKLYLEMCKNMDIKIAPRNFLRDWDINKLNSVFQYSKSIV